MLSSVRTRISTGGSSRSTGTIAAAAALFPPRVASVRHRSTIRDTSYPFALYFHLLPGRTSSHIHAPPSVSAASDRHDTYALSFLPKLPKHNRQVIGYLSHDPSSTSELQVRPNKFTENEAFNTLLHAVIQQNLDKDPMVTQVLQLQLEGWTHIADYRNPAPYGRIPLPEDIFGSVQIVDGVIQPSTYQRMPSHRIVSSNGLFQLSDYLYGVLLQRLINL